MEELNDMFGSGRKDRLITLQRYHALRMRIILHPILAWI